MNILENIELAKPTSLTRKLTLNGITKIYPVYKIHIDALYYNDQNDRIASWISQYKDENGIESLTGLEREKYNDIIEKFIVYSNPMSIEKTQNNIQLVGQREPGVVLSDGRIIDGNRRYTCIRRISKSSPDNCWFEAVVLGNNLDMESSKKAIKMLELTIQHGEEKRVDYNHIEKLIGIYNDIIDTKLLTIEEYATSTNESVNEVKKKVEAAKILAEFLAYINLEKQFHVAREYQIVALINDLVELLKKCIEISEKERLKKIIFANILMNTIGDGRAFIKNLSIVMSNGMFEDFIKEQEEIQDILLERLYIQSPKNYSELRIFYKSNNDLADSLKFSLEDAAKGARTKELYKKPSQIVSKTINSLRDIDVNIVRKLGSTEKSKMKNQINMLSKTIQRISNIVDPQEENENLNNNTNSNPIPDNAPKIITIPDNQKGNKENYFKIIPSKYCDYIDIENESKNVITNSIIRLNVKLKYENNLNKYKFYFVNNDYKVCSNVIDLSLTNSYQSLIFNFDQHIEKNNHIYLVIKKEEDKENEARFLLEYDVNIVFVSDF